MPISTEIQNKVLKIASNKGINNKAKIAVRKRFYELKNEELGIEEIQEDFNIKTMEFDAQLDAVLEQLKNIPTVDTVEAPIPKKEVPMKKAYGDEEEEEIITPPKDEPKKPGIKVRMQEELDTSTEEDTDFEVPFEADEQ